VLPELSVSGGQVSAETKTLRCSVRLHLLYLLSGGPGFSTGCFDLRNERLHLVVGTWPECERSDATQFHSPQKVKQCRFCEPCPFQTGERPTDHAQVLDVTVIIRTEGRAKYFFLDSNWRLVCDQELPKRCKIEPFRISEPPIATLNANAEGRAPRVAIQEEPGDAPVSDGPFMPSRDIWSPLPSQI
jgi:hypothetical protein